MKKITYMYGDSYCRGNTKYNKKENERILFREYLIFSFIIQNKSLFFFRFITVKCFVLTNSYFVIIFMLLND